METKKQQLQLFQQLNKICPAWYVEFWHESPEHPGHHNGTRAILLPLTPVRNPDHIQQLLEELNTSFLQLPHDPSGIPLLHQLVTMKQTPVQTILKQFITQDKIRYLLSKKNKCILILLQSPMNKTPTNRILRASSFVVTPNHHTSTRGGGGGGGGEDKDSQDGTFVSATSHPRIKKSDSNKSFQTASSGLLGEQCPICIQQLQSKQYQTTPCNHNFHKQCLHKWLRSKKTCPTCRKILTKSGTRTTTGGGGTRTTTGGGGVGGGGGGTRTSTGGGGGGGGGTRTTTGGGGGGRFEDEDWSNIPDRSTVERTTVFGGLRSMVRQATDRIRIQRIKHELERRGLPRRIIDKAVLAYRLRQHSEAIHGPSSFLRMLEVLSHVPSIVHFSQVLRDLFVSDEERDRIIHIFQILLSEQT